MDWAQVQVLRREGCSQREVARRLAVNRRTVARLWAASAPPRYARGASGSILDPFLPQLEQLVAAWPLIKAPRATEVLGGYGYSGSVDLVKRALRELRPRVVRPAQRTGYAPGQVLQIDWVEMPTRPVLHGRERRVYALVGVLSYSGAQSAFFSFEMTLEAFLEGHVRLLGWLGGVPRECVYDNLKSVVGRRDETGRVVWQQRFWHLRGHYAFHATACTPATPREKGGVERGVGYLQTGFWPARTLRSIRDLQTQYDAWRDEVCNQRRHGSGGFWVADRLAQERSALAALPPIAFDPSAGRTTRVPIDGYIKVSRCFYRAPTTLVQQRVEVSYDRDEVRVVHRGGVVARYPRSYQDGVWIPAPVPRPLPPPPPPQPAWTPTVPVALPELAAYAELSA
jgi:transposase